MTGAGSFDDMAALLRRWLSIKFDPNRSKIEIELAVLGNSSACQKNKILFICSFVQWQPWVPSGTGTRYDGVLGNKLAIAREYY